MNPSRNETRISLQKEIVSIQERLVESKRTLEFQARREIQSLSERLNAIAPIHILPDDLMVVIFNTLDLKDAEGSNILFTYLLGIASVCQRWYSVVCGSPLFWSTRNLADGEWPEEFHALSGNTPITAKAEIRSSNCLRDAVSSFEQILSSGCTVQSFKITVSSHYYPSRQKDYLRLTEWRDWEACFRKSSSFFESLSFDLDSVLLRSLVESEAFPNLQRLRISYSDNFNWTSSLFSPTLQHLTLQSLPFDTPSYINELYGTLRILVQLRGLTLIFHTTDTHDICWSTDCYTTPSAGVSHPEVKLEHLQKLSVRGDLCIVAQFLKDLELGPEAKLDIGSRFDPDAPRTIPTNPPILSGHEYRTLLHNVARILKGLTGSGDPIRTIELLGTGVIRYGSPVGDSVRFVAYTRRILPIRYGRRDPMFHHYLFYGKDSLLFDCVNPLLALLCERPPRDISSEPNLAEPKIPERNFVSRFLVNSLPNPSSELLWPRISLDSLEVVHLGGDFALSDPTLLQAFKHTRILTIQGTYLVTNILPFLVNVNGPTLIAFPNLTTLVCEENPEETLSSFIFTSPLEECKPYTDQLEKMYETLYQIVAQRNGLNNSLNDNFCDAGVKPLKEIYINPVFHEVASSSHNFPDLFDKDEKLRQIGQECGVDMVMDREWQAKVW
ncbi:hypothetical protein C8Q75DRAFT_249802 [Abortiporus biennis]|nr:hypothetical protein C8Q75DRAFT_249802 [Abortiporus biennis]